MADFLQVSTATETREGAVRLAQSVVSARLAAGAQIVGPVISVFWHRGEFGTGEEWQLLFKARADRYDEIEAHLLKHHPWNNPEVSAVPIVAGSAAYLRWVETATAPDSEG
ncbi:divalent-cation tolerance protein CutA [Streptomyces noursei]|uniref:divalent-cation tolerance protein CutA n=1 Tax=Streptomyces noursei TaxID=1971 RepID=UPI0035DB5D57